MPSLVTLLLPPLGSIASQDTQFISLLPILAISSIESLRESKIAESSAEAELYALATARKFARNFRLLIQESFATSIVMSLRCDNTAAISMLEEPGWRTRYISIYAEAIRQEMQQRTLTLTYVSTEHQLADPLTKPTSALVNSIIFPQWGLVRFCP